MEKASQDRSSFSPQCKVMQWLACARAAGAMPPTISPRVARIPHLTAFCLVPRLRPFLAPRVWTALEQFPLRRQMHRMFLFGPTI